MKQNVRQFVNYTKTDVHVKFHPVPMYIFVVIPLFIFSILKSMNFAKKSLFC